MVIHIPGEDAARMKYTYTDIFMYTLMWDVAIPTIAATGLWLLLFIIKILFIKKPKIVEQEQILEYLVTKKENDQEQSNPDEEEEDNREQINKEERVESSVVQEMRMPDSNAGWDLKTRIIVYSTSFFFYVMLVCISVIYMSAYMFGKFGVGTLKDVLNIAAMSGIVILPTVIWKVATRTKSWARMNRELIVTGVLLVLWIGVAITGALLTRNACLCVFNDRYGGQINKDFQISTQFTRSKQIGQVCKADSVCHLYATLPEDSDRSVFINIQTGTDIQKVEVALLEKAIYDEAPIFTNIGTATKYEVGTILEPNGQRNLFSILFNNLKPETLYVLRVQAGSKTILTQYRTLPGFDSETPLKIAFGGDVGMTDVGQALTNNLADQSNFDPDVIILGGDIAYDDGMPSCYYSWDTFYQIFESLNNKINRLVPLILSVGNHDVGFDALASVNVTASENGPFFFAFHPQHYAFPDNKSGIPEIKNRRTYHYHKLGKTLHLNLDSGYVHSFESQNQFIQQTSEKYPAYYKFANYHNPIYPTCSDMSVKQQRDVLNQSRTHWVPLFQKYDFMAAMEHHTHHLKVTYPLTNGEVDNETGVLYIGDGCWGVYNEPCPASHRVDRSRFATAQDDDSEHVWLMTFRPSEQISYIAKNPDGKTVASQKQNLKQKKSLKHLEIVKRGEQL